MKKAESGGTKSTFFEDVFVAIIYHKARSAISVTTHAQVKFWPTKNNDFLKLEIALISISIVFDFLLHDDDDDDAM